jgi:RsiW-degrading membrane proteinase PrsW (M82 family)
MVAAVLVALLPVSAFLLVLVLSDSFKLVSRGMLIGAVMAGAGAAIVGVLAHRQLLAAGLAPHTVSRYVAPVIEECLKALFVLYAMRQRKIGFLVDAAIIGFAVGTGFALVENVEYLSVLGAPALWLWVARGCGTAILHAGTTALVAIAAKSWAERAPGRTEVAVIPGLLAAIVLHSAYNHLLVHPLLAATLLMLVMPSIVLFVFGRSERATREWVGDGLDLDVELLNLVTSSHFGTTRLGRYLNELKARFPGPIVADMFCLLQLDLELSIRAKGMLLAREQGLKIPMDDSMRARLDERMYLHKSIGPTGLLALRPLQVTNDRDDWLRYLLKQR